MLKEKMLFIRDYIVRHYKVAFPVIVIAAVAFTVVLALNAGNRDAMANETEAPDEGPVTEEEMLDGSVIREVTDEPMALNTNPALDDLMKAYFDAQRDGDIELLRSIKNYTTEPEEIKIYEMSKYLKSYQFVEINTKPGPFAGTYIVYIYYMLEFNGCEGLFPALHSCYVRTDADGELYIDAGIDAPEEVLNYMWEINEKEDVVAFKTQVDIECSNTYIENIGLYDYMIEVSRLVDKSVGEELAKRELERQSEQIVADNGEETDGDTEATGNQEGEETPAEGQVPVQAGPIYAKATTTVNVRSSDSEQAEKIDKVPSGTKIEVLEQRVNGWSKIRYNSKEGYIKSEYLQVEVVQGGEAIGTVKATSNVNIRASAGETADRIGMVPGGETMELLARENGWCKIRYGGIVGYVKSDYVQ